MIIAWLTIVVGLLCQEHPIHRPNRHNGRLSGRHVAPWVMSPPICHLDRHDSQTSVRHLSPVPFDLSPMVDEGRAINQGPFPPFQRPFLGLLDFFNNIWGYSFEPSSLSRAFRVLYLPSSLVALHPFSVSGDLEPL